VFGVPGYFAFWSALHGVGFRRTLQPLALQVLVLLTLHGTAVDVGLGELGQMAAISSLGLDRPVRSWIADDANRSSSAPILRAVLLGAIPLLYIAGWLNTAVLVVFVAFFGVFRFRRCRIAIVSPARSAEGSLLAAHAQNRSK
jgi:hypothetical protein